MAWWGETASPAARRAGATGGDATDDDGNAAENDIVTPNLAPAPGPTHPLGGEPASSRVHRPDEWLRGRTEGELRSIAAQAARLAGSTGWGAHGHVAGVRERVPCYRLWVAADAPGHGTRPTRANPAERPGHRSGRRGGAHADARRRTLVAGLHLVGQLAPIVVTPYADPRPEAEGGRGGDLLVLDGAARLEAASRSEGGEVEVVVLPRANRYVTELRLLAVAAAEGRLARPERGRALLRLCAAYEHDRREGAALLPYPPAPEALPATLGALVGLSARQARRWLALARQPEEIVGLVAAGRLTLDQALALRRVESDVPRVAQARELAAQMRRADVAYPDSTPGSDDLIGGWP